MTPVDGPVQSSSASRALGHPRLHLRCTDSTNEQARALAIAGAPHGTLVTAGEQTAGRGRQGRSWVGPAGSALLCSLVLRDAPALLSLIAAVGVCDVVGRQARVKWPNDIVVEAPIGAVRPTPTPPAVPGSALSSGVRTDPTLAKLAGILVEGRPQEGWTVLGIGLNVAVRIEELPPELRGRAASLELPRSSIESLLGRLMGALEHRFGESAERVLDAWRARDALAGREIAWGAHNAGFPSTHGDRWSNCGEAGGIDDSGRLIVTLADGTIAKLDAGEVHLGHAH